MLDTIFSVCGTVAMVGWLGLVLLPKNRIVVEWIARVFIPAAIGVVYISLMLVYFGAAPADGSFSSLAAVRALFSIDGLLLAGWIHYLAFDLFVGSWEVTDSQKEGISHWLIIPCLFLTFMAGPAGLLLYFVIKYLRRALHKDSGQVAA